MIKKGFIVAIALIGLVFNNAVAQKFGYVNTLEILSLMPEMKKVQESLDSYQVVLQNEYDKELKKYQELEAEYLKLKNDPNASPAIIGLKEQELMEKQDKLQKLPGMFEEELIQKQTLLMTPLGEKLQNAIKEVAKEKGLSYIFDISKGALVYWDEADDVNKDVKKKLGIAETATIPK